MPGAVKYRLYRTVDGTTTNRYVTEPIYTDTDVVAGKTYIYYVKTYSDMANSGNSAKVSITVSVVPDAPTGVKVTSSLSGITVTWNAVPGVTKYRVIRTVDGVTTKTKVSGTSWTDTAPVADANNVYSVQAQAADGTYSTVSESKSLYYPLGIAVKVSGSKANLSWTPVTGATKYQVYRRPQVNGKYGAWELIYSAKGTSFVDTPGAGIWQYRVRAVVDGTKTGYSNRKKVTVG